jgi:hypothetical protein
VLARQLGSNPEAREPDFACFVDEHIRRLDVLMYETVLMDLGDCFRQANSHAQEASQVERLPVVPLKNPIQRFTARVIQ